MLNTQFVGKISIEIQLNIVWLWVLKLTRRLIEWENVYEKGLEIYYALTVGDPISRSYALWLFDISTCLLSSTDINKREGLGTCDQGC